MKYRKPSFTIKDRHVLIELDMDKHDEYDVRHLLNKAYLNHKAPHEYSDIKRYIRDIIFSKHNSVYIMNNGLPEPLASASILGSPYISAESFNAAEYYDYMTVVNSVNCGNVYVLNLITSTSNCNNVSTHVSPLTYGYNNGTAVQWGVLYLPTQFNKATSVSSSYLLISPSQILEITNISPKYAYAPYISSTSPLTLTAYYYWQNSTSNTINETYAYFGLMADITVGISCGGATSFYIQPTFVPLFYAQGSFSFSPSTYYMSSWQWTYQ